MSKRSNWINVANWARTAAPYVRSALNAYSAYRSANVQGSSPRLSYPSRSSGRSYRRSYARRPYRRVNKRPAYRARRRVYRRRAPRSSNCMIANNPRLDNTRWIRFSHVIESGLTWTLSNTIASAEFKTIALDSAWLPATGHNPLAEAAFNEFERKMLTKVTWKMQNFRIFVATQLYQPAISQASPPMNAPAQQTFDVQQKWGWKFWRFNMTDPGQSLLPSNKEERANSFIVNGPRSQIYGTMHLGKARQMNWYTGDYASMKSAYGNLVDYLKHYMVTGLRGDVSGVVPPQLPITECYPTLNIQLMPDDPYPNSVMTNTQLVQCRISVECDIHMYATFLCNKMTQS